MFQFVGVQERHFGEMALIWDEAQSGRENLEVGSKKLISVFWKSS